MKKVRKTKKQVIQRKKLNLLQAVMDSGALLISAGRQAAVWIGSWILLAAMFCWFSVLCLIERWRQWRLRRKWYCSKRANKATAETEQPAADQSVNWTDLPAEKMCWCTGRRPVIAALPVWVNPRRESRTVCIDVCIEPTIRKIWEAGIETLSCCCGHGKRPPSVVIGWHHGDSDIEKLKTLLAAVDGRPWEIFQWKRVLEKVN